ncbi:MAG: hypothetical protein E7418_01020 [Ruminococcaceae bacterium]|nr:hypothetical protein [Oscillospiraceae bacterium]
MHINQTEIAVTFDVILVYLEFKKSAAEVAADLFLQLRKMGAKIDSLNLMPLRRPAFGLSFAVESDDFAKVLKVASILKDKSDPMQLTVCGGYAKITIVSAQDALSGFFESLSSALPETVCLSATGTALSALVPMADLDKMLSELEKAFPSAKTVYAGEDA